MRVAGLDPSLSCTGYARPDGSVVRIPSSTDHPTLDRIDSIDRALGRLVSPPDRLDTSSGRARMVPDPARPELVVVEGFGGAGRGREAGLKITGLGTVLRLRVWRAGIPLFEVAPATLKAYATGNGRADKRAMREAYAERLRPTIPDRPLDVGHDEIDALWLRDVGLWLNYPASALLYAGPHEGTDRAILGRLCAGFDAVDRPAARS